MKKLLVASVMMFICGLNAYGKSSATVKNGLSKRSGIFIYNHAVNFGFEDGSSQNKGSFKIMVWPSYSNTITTRKRKCVKSITTAIDYCTNTVKCRRGTRNDYARSGKCLSNVEVLLEGPSRRSRSKMYEEVDIDDVMLIGSDGEEIETYEIDPSMLGRTPIMNFLLE